MKHLTTISFLLLFSSNLIGQNDSIQNEDRYRYYDTFNEYWKSVTFKIGGGMFLPQGQLKDYLDASALVELSLDFPVTDNKSIELALQFIVPKQRIPFQYIRDEESIEADASLIVNPFVRFKKDIGKTNVSNFTLGLGLGASVISTTEKVLWGMKLKHYKIRYVNLWNNTIQYLIRNSTY